MEERPSLWTWAKALFQGSLPDAILPLMKSSSARLFRRAGWKGAAAEATLAVAAEMAVVAADAGVAAKIPIAKKAGMKRLVLIICIPP
jgi:hypothetical protein